MIITVYDTPSGMGGTHTVSIKEIRPNNYALVRIWYGRATANGWESWAEWDGATYEVDRNLLTNPRQMNTVKVD